MGGDFGYCFRARGGWGSRRRTADEKGGVSRRRRRFGKRRARRRLPSGAARPGVHRGEEYLYRVPLGRGEIGSAPGARRQAGAGESRFRCHRRPRRGPPRPASPGKATKTIPIIMAQDNDPVASGFVASLARPGGNITGLSVLFPEMTGKRVELVKDIVPKLSRMTVIGTLDQPGTAETLKETQVAARSFGVEIQLADVKNSKALDAAFQTARKFHADAGLVLSSAVIFSYRTQIARLAADHRLPIMFPQSEYVEDGGLISYAPNYPDLFRRAATYVDKILKGAKPADLPVEQPTKFELVINLNTAKQIGLTIPPNVLARADRVIK